MSLHIYDVSAHNSRTIPTCDLAFVKATEGRTYTSSAFGPQRNSALANAHAWGPYHFARPEESSAKDQCDRFLDVSQPKENNPVMFDLEASQIGQGPTNTWAKTFAERLREQLPYNKTILYMGSGYATNGTGKGLKDFFDYWMYPQYPAKYQTRRLNMTPWGIENLRAMNRSSVIPGRSLIASITNEWPAVAPWLPKGLTCGWTAVDLWQFTDNHSPGGLDASVSSRTLKDLTASKRESDQWQTWFLGTSG